MATSQARIDANRRNALKSTGPRTAEGKAKSRANALKHGLSGAGLLVPPDDLARVAEVEANLIAEFGPRTEHAATLVHRYAVLSVRLERCERHDAAMTARRVRTALIDRDNQRHDEIAAHAMRLADEPADAVRRLKQTPEGLEWLIGQWMEVRALVAGPVDDPAALADRAGCLLGLPPVRARAGEWGAWSRAVAGGPSDLAEDPTRWAVARVDREIEVLNNLLSLVDWEAEQADKDEAAARALLDFGPEGEKARRYEAAAHRELFRVLRELQRAQAEAIAHDEPKPEPIPAPVPAPAPPPPPPPARIPASYSAAERAVLADLPVPVRNLAIELGDFIDIAAIPAAVAAVRGQATPKSKRPKLR